jgi:hypothetical protein
VYSTRKKLNKKPEPHSAECIQGLQTLDGKDLFAEDKNGGLKYVGLYRGKSKKGINQIQCGYGKGNDA